MVLVNFVVLVMSIVVDAVYAFLFPCIGCTFFHLVFSCTMGASFFPSAFIGFVVIKATLKASCRGEVVCYITDLPAYF